MLMGQVTEVLPFTSWGHADTDSRHGNASAGNRNGERAMPEAAAAISLSWS